MNWADAHGISYLAWGWTIPGMLNPTDTPCRDFPYGGQQSFRLFGSFGEPLAPDRRKPQDSLATVGRRRGDMTWLLRMVEYSHLGTPVFTVPLATSDWPSPLLAWPPLLMERGYWLVASDGGVFTFGDASFCGSAGNLLLAKPIVGMAATPDGRGTGCFRPTVEFSGVGDADFYGSAGSKKLQSPVVSMAATLDGKGYWMVASDGSVISFGDAENYGSAGNLRLAKPIVGMAATPGGNGYWLTASDGGVFSFGGAEYYGSIGQYPIAQTGGWRHFNVPQWRILVGGI